MTKKTHTHYLIVCMYLENSAKDINHNKKIMNDESNQDGVDNKYITFI